MSCSLLPSLACKWQATQKRKWWIEIEEKQEEEKIKNNVMFSLCSPFSFLFIFFSFFLSRLLISRHECIDLCVVSCLSAFILLFTFDIDFFFHYFFRWLATTFTHAQGFFFQFLRYLRSILKPPTPRWCYCTWQLVS